MHDKLVDRVEGFSTKQSLEATKRQVNEEDANEDRRSRSLQDNLISNDAEPLMLPLFGLLVQPMLEPRQIRSLQEIEIQLNVPLCHGYQRMRIVAPQQIEKSV